MTPPRLILKIEDWPASDRAAWDAMFAEGGLFDDGGGCVHWSEGSRRKRAQGYGHWLGFLASLGALDPNVVPTERITRDQVQAFIVATEARVAPISTATRVSDLYVIARAFDPKRDWSWLKRLADRLRHQARVGQLKPRIGISPQEIFTWAMAEMDAAEAMKSDDGRLIRPVRYRDGLMIALLAARPLRRRTFIGIEIDTHLVRSGEGYLLRFRPEDMKDRKAREFELPVALVAPMTCYLDQHRRALLQGNETPALWVSRRGGPLSRNGFQQHLSHVTDRAFGLELYPHAFRHIAATSIAEEDPAHVSVIASLLGHATLDMSEKHYNRASGVKAAASYQEIIRDRRREARRRERSQGRLRGDGRPPDVAD